MSRADHPRLPLRQKAGFGFGALVTIVATTAFANMANLFFNLELKVDPVLIGLAMAVPRLWDGITDPLMGVISDNTRLRWGRRIPYVMAGGVLVGLVFALVWWVPVGWSTNAVFIWFLVLSLVFYTALTIFAVPHGALGLELTPDYDERTKVQAYGSFFGNVAALATPWFYKIANLPYFSSIVEGVRWTGVAVGSVLALSAVLCALMCTEPNRRHAQLQPREKFWHSFVTTCRNPVFVRLLAVVVMVTVGFHLVAGFNNYITIFYLYNGDKSAAATLLGVGGTVWALTAILAVFPMTLLSRRFGKARTTQLFLVVMGAGNLLKIVCYNPEMPYLVLFPTVMLSFGMLVLYSLMGAMAADICDEDELHTGLRREGSYSAVYGWWSKIGMSLAAIVSGYLLNATAFNANLPQQSADTMFRLRALEIALPAMLCFLGAYLLGRYPLTPQRARRNQAELRKRLAAKGDNVGGW